MTNSSTKSIKHLKPALKSLPGGKKAVSFLEEFKTFINRGSVIDLAVGVIVGGAFSKIVSSLVSDILMPLVGVLLGGVNFSALNITIPNFFGGTGSSRIAYGMFLQNVVDFIIIAFSIFLIVRFINHLQDAKKPTTKSTDQSTPAETELSILKDILATLKTSPKSKPNK